MKLVDVHDGMMVRIIAGEPVHPLNGRVAEVVLVTAPLPDSPPASRGAMDPELMSRISSNLDDEASRQARAYRVRALEVPFAWPDGQVHLYLMQREESRCWVTPYVTVGPGDIEPA